MMREPEFRSTSRSRRDRSANAKVCARTTDKGGLRGLRYSLLCGNNWKETAANTRYHALLTPIQRFTDSKTADAGYSNLLFRGCPVVEDSYCPSGYLIFWNLDYCNLYSHSQRTFPGELVDFQKPINQDVAVAHLRWAGEFICSAPRFQGVMTALTA